MEVIVDDTNILIDLANTGLLAHCMQMDISFCTTDMVISELRNTRQLDIVNGFRAEGGLNVCEMKGNELINVVTTYQELEQCSNLSPADVSVMLLAERLNCRLLSNDQKLIRQARERGIEANGLLWLTDLMVETNVVSPRMMVEYLNQLLITNDRAPRKLIDERISKYIRDAP